MHWQAVSHDTAFFVPVFWVKKLRSGDEFFTQNTKENTKEPSGLERSGAGD